MEWVGGRLPAPVYVGEGDTPSRVDVVLWVEYPADLIVGLHMTTPDQEDASLAALLQQAMESPLAGRPRRPTRVRVSTAADAREIRRLHGDSLVVRVGPTPELDAVIDHMARHLGGGAAGRSYLDGGVSPEAVARMFDAALDFHRRAAWQALGDAGPIRVDLRDQGVHGGILTVIGALGESFGLLLFPSAPDYDRFLRAASTRRRDARRPKIGTSLRALLYEPASRLSPRMRREAMAHGWSVASPSAYPLVEHREADGQIRPASALDLEIMTLCARLLTAFIEEHGSRLGPGSIPMVSRNFLPDQPEAWLTMPADWVVGFAPPPGLRQVMELTPPRRRRKPRG